MARAPRACSSPGCELMHPCPRHTRPPWDGRLRPGARARGYDAEYERNRAIVLAEETHCALCGKLGLPDDQADHIIPLAVGGTSARSNLQRAHRACNAAKNARARQRSRAVTERP